MDAVAGHLHDRATMGQYCRARNRVMARERWPHPFRVELPQPGAALDIREEIGDGWRRFGHALAYGSVNSGRIDIESVTRQRPRYAPRYRLSRKTARAALPARRRLSTGP